MAVDQKINVCHIASGDLWAGAEVQMYTLLRALRGEPKLNLSAVILNPGKLAELLKELGIDVAVLDESRDNFIVLRRKMIAILDGRNIDIIHSHRYKENILVASVKTKCRIRKLIQTIHGASEPARGIALYKSRLYAAANRAVTRRYFDRIITVSDDIRRRLKNRLPEARLATIWNAIDKEEIKPSKTPEAVKREFRLDSAAPLVGAVGRMVPVKAYDLFLKSAQMILKRRSDARFILAGDGPLRQSLQEMSAQLGISDKVFFPGFRDDIVDIMNSFDLFVISSFHEGVPMALLEAMSLKKAIVSTAVGGIKEVIEDGQSGILVKPESAEALADACLRVIDDDILRRNLGEAAAERVDRQFSVDILKRRVISLYEKALSET